jgi:hypothetical protein
LLKEKKTLYDKTLYPNKCAYVIAQAHTRIKDDGFGIVYPDPGFDYFPTAHENTKLLHEYDVMCYNCFDVDYIPINNYEYGEIQLVNTKTDLHHKNGAVMIDDIFFHLEDRVIMSKEGNSDQFELNVKYKNINYFEIDGVHPNQNVILQ